MRRSVIKGLGLALLLGQTSLAKADEPDQMAELVPYSSPSQLPKGCDDLRPPHETPEACRSHLKALARALEKQTTLKFDVRSAATTRCAAWASPLA